MTISRRTWLAGTALPLLASQGCSPREDVIAGGFTGIAVERGHLLREAKPAAAEGGTATSAAGPAQAAATRRTRVVIAGGGVAGLAAARALRLRGIDDFMMLELEDEAGGNSRSGAVQGLPCPLGAHYLPVPGDDAHEVLDLLEELGLRQRIAGRWQYDERHLCHSPQERLFLHGEWQEGLLPLQGMAAGTLAQYQRFADRVAQLQRTAGFALPAFRAPFAAVHAALDSQTFAQWLAREGLDDAYLRWYLDYCCRDDYGAGIATVSAWAGIHYFASRHGFHAPSSDATDSDERDAVLTWPEGNGWITRRLAQPLGERLQTGRVIMRIAESRRGVVVDAFNVATKSIERWEAEQCIVALPVFVAARVVQNPPAFVTAAAASLRYAPWLVANLHIREPLTDHPGAAPSWDNVIHGTSGLGYVDAGHQSLRQQPGATVLTWYRALGGQADGRAQLLQRPWSSWRDEMLAELGVPHADLRGKITRIDITRYGHAMAMPVPGLMQQLRGIDAPHSGRLRFAHADWAGYSVFEEAFARGHAAGNRV